MEFTRISIKLMPALSLLLEFFLCLNSTQSHADDYCKNQVSLVTMDDFLVLEFNHYRFLLQSHESCMIEKVSSAISWLVTLLIYSSKQSMEKYPKTEIFLILRKIYTLVLPWPAGR